MDTLLWRDRRLVDFVIFFDVLRLCRDIVLKRVLVPEPVVNMWRGVGDMWRLVDVRSVVDMLLSVRVCVFVLFVRVCVFVLFVRVCVFVLFVRVCVFVLSMRVCVFVLSIRVCVLVRVVLPVLLWELLVPVRVPDRLLFLLLVLVTSPLHGWYLHSHLHDRLLKI